MKLSNKICAAFVAFLVAIAALVLLQLHGTLPVNPYDRDSGDAYDWGYNVIRLLFAGLFVLCLGYLIWDNRPAEIHQARQQKLRVAPKQADFIFPESLMQLPTMETSQA